MDYRGFDHLSTLATGFSIVACLVLLIAYLCFLPEMRKTIAAKLACAALLIGLAALQMAHSLYFGFEVDLLARREYGLLLAVVPASFYFFSRQILSVNTNQPKRAGFDLCHVTPLVLALFLPIAWLPPLAFLFGTGYTFWFARVVIKLRGHTKRFKFELFFFGMFALMALGALTLGLLLPTLDPYIFYVAYANAISIALLSTLSALLFFPQLLSDILIVGELAYAKTRLADIDIEIKLEELQKLMSEDKQFQNEDLNLTLVAELLNLTPHQLSELINSHFGFGFPKYVRARRIDEAKRLLVEDRNVSILAISMETGFKSQSNFYTAFKEITGLSPGQFRKKNP